MTYSIKYFMWGWQGFFRADLEGIASQLFTQLDQRLEPSVFLVGALTNPTRTDRHPSCVEPEQDFWIHSDEFHGVLEVAEQIAKEFPEAQIIHSHPLERESQERHLRRLGIRDAIQATIESHPCIPEARRVYVSLPTQVDDYLVSVVLMLREDVASSYSELRRSRILLHPYRSYRVPTSLIDSAALEFLRFGEEELRKEDPSMSLTADTDTMLRTAGTNLARGAVWRMSRQSILNGHGLYRDCSAISSMRYERAEGTGRILFAVQDHPQVHHSIKLFEPVSLHEYRAARKLLQLAFEEVSLLSDGSEITGIKDRALDWGPDESVFEVEIVAHHRWELRSHGRHLMTVRYGLPSLPKPAFDEAEFRGLVKETFPCTDSNGVNRLCRLVRQASREHHGTMLVISPNVGGEVERLSSQATSIEPRLLDEPLLRHLTPIDGAIVIDSAGLCHGIGVILDGEATGEGNPARGARFNSAVRYIQSVKGTSSSLAVVVSEDGGVDIVS